MKIYKVAIWRHDHITAERPSHIEKVLDFYQIQAESLDKAKAVARDMVEIDVEEVVFSKN